MAGSVFGHSKQGDHEYPELRMPLGLVPGSETTESKARCIFDLTTHGKRVLQGGYTIYALESSCTTTSLPTEPYPISFVAYLMSGYR